MIRGAIFDVDGTLLDSMGIWDDAGERFLNKNGIQAKPGLRDVLFTMSLPEGAEYLIREYHVDMPPEEIIRGVATVVSDFYIYEAKLKPGVLEFLRSMQEHGIPMTIATSSERSCISPVFERLGILDYFQEIYTCSELYTSKKKPDIYYRASELFSASEKEICVFEDALHAIQTAEAAGFCTVGMYDASSEADQDKIREHSRIYLKDFRNIDEFWRQTEGTL